MQLNLPFSLVACWISCWINLLIFSLKLLYLVVDSQQNPFSRLFSALSVTFPVVLTVVDSLLTSFPLLRPHPSSPAMVSENLEIIRQFLYLVGQAKRGRIFLDPDTLPTEDTTHACDSSTPSDEDHESDTDHDGSSDGAPEEDGTSMS